MSGSCCLDVDTALAGTRITGGAPPAEPRGDLGDGPRERGRLWAGVRHSRGLRELGFMALVYVGYLSRVVADSSLGPARDTAMAILATERQLHINVESELNSWFRGNDVLGMLGAFYYAAAHYVVTAAVLVWLFRRRPRHYKHPRRALLVATGIALVGYLVLPTAPPRLVQGYTDLMVVHAGIGWWGEAASAPQGLGWLTNQLAAFPSMHAGWALWVALAVRRACRSRAVRALGWSHAAVTAVVVVGTANHWLLDVVAGWAIVWAAWAVAGGVRHVTGPGGYLVLGPWTRTPRSTRSRS